MELKRIRTDYYNYRLRKGRADILLQKDPDSDKYCIPYHYVTAEELFPWGIDKYRTEDDGDLVLINYTLDDCHLKKNDMVWIPLEKVPGLVLKRNEFLHVSHNIFTFFLRLCPAEGESGIRRRIKGILEAVKVEIAKRQYVVALRRVLEGKPIMVFDACMTQPDPDLIRKEMETLEHFRLYKPPLVAMNQRDGDLASRDLYGFEPIDWRALGAEYVSFPPTDLEHRMDDIEED